MFAPIEIPSGCVMLSSLVDLKDGVSVEDVEPVPGEMCNVAKNTCGDGHGGFIAGQACKHPGFVSGQGSIGEPPAGGGVAAGLRQGEPEQAGSARAGMP